MPSYQCRGKNKLWSVRFLVIENGSEVQKRLSRDPETNEPYKRKKDAEQGYINFINKYKENQKIVNADKNIMENNFEDVFAIYLKYKMDKIKSSSLYDNTKLAYKHIIPYFKGMKIKQITKPIILSWQNSLGSYSYKYKQKIRGILYSFFKYLYLYHDVDNVVARVEPFTKPNTKKEMSIWTNEDFNKFISTLKDDLLYETFFMTLYYTGCRLGEVLSLNYNDLDINKKILDINKNLTSKVYKRDDSKTYEIITPKNQSSYRKIKLPDILISQFKKYISQYDVKNSLFLFGGDKPLDDHTIYRRLSNHTKAAELKTIRIHDFRHSHASLLINQGANVVLVAKRLGHSNTEQTLNTYSHLFPNTEDDIVEKINKLDDHKQAVTN